MFGRPLAVVHLKDGLRSLAPLGSRGGCLHMFWKWSCVTDTGPGRMRAFSSMTPDALMRTVEDFLAGARDAVVLDDGAFCSIWHRRSIPFRGSATSACFIFGQMSEIWSGGCLMWRSRIKCCDLAVQRLGQTSPESWRSAGNATGELPRQNGLRATGLPAKFAGNIGTPIFRLWTRQRLSTAIDLERSFGPIYARGLLRRGQSGFAVLGVNPQETQSSIDAALTFAILWLDVCREAQAGRCWSRA